MRICRAASAMCATCSSRLACGASRPNDRHGDVLGGERGHAASSSAIELQQHLLDEPLGGERVVRGLRGGSASLVERVERAVERLEEADRLPWRPRTLSSRNGNWSSCQTPSQLFLRSVWKNSNVSTRCTEPTTMSSSQPRKLSLTSIANSRPASMHSCAASAGVSSPYREWPKSSRMPRLSRPTCWMASRVRAAFGKMILFRGSRGLYSMTNLMSGWALTQLAQRRRRPASRCRGSRPGTGSPSRPGRTRA